MAHEQHIDVDSVIAELHDLIDWLTRSRQGGFCGLRGSRQQKRNTIHRVKLLCKGLNTKTHELNRMLSGKWTVDQLIEKLTRGRRLKQMIIVSTSLIKVEKSGTGLTRVNPTTPFILKGRLPGSFEGGKRR